MTKYLTKYILPIALVTIFVILIGFIVTGNHWATRQWGGEEELHLPANKKLVNATWRNSSLWLLTRPMSSHEVPEVYDFIESSNLDIMNGTVHIIEHKGGDY